MLMLITHSNSEPISFNNISMNWQLCVFLDFQYQIMSNTKPRKLRKTLQLIKLPIIYINNDQNRQLANIRHFGTQPDCNLFKNKN